MAALAAGRNKRDSRFYMEREAFWIPSFFLGFGFLFFCCCFSSAMTSRILHQGSEKSLLFCGAISNNYLILQRLKRPGPRILPLLCVG